MVLSLSLGGTPVKTANLTYDANINIAFNRNKVISLYPKFNVLNTSPEGNGGATLSGFQAAGTLQALVL
jgi:hypothetical protein